MLAAAGAITNAVPLTGDEDTLPAVEDAQAHGVLVHLWGIEPPYGPNQAEPLVWEDDTVHVLDRTVLACYVDLAPSAQPASTGDRARRRQQGRAPRRPRWQLPRRRPRRWQPQPRSPPGWTGPAWHR